MISACYPMFKDLYNLDYSQIGLITLTSQMTASLLQPLIGSYTDRRPRPFSLPIGMGFTLVGSGDAFPGGQLAHNSVFLRAGRGWIVRLPSGVGAGGPHGFRRTAWHGTVVLPSRRHHRLRAWSIAGSPLHFVERAA